MSARFASCHISLACMRHHDLARASRPDESVRLNPLVRSASPRLRAPVDHSHHLHSPILVASARVDRRRDLGFSHLGRIVEVRRGASAPPLRLGIGFKLANSLPKGPMPAAYTLTCPGPATPPCRGAYQTGLPHSRVEMPEYIDCDHTAATHTLLAALVQNRASCASVTTAGGLKHSSSSAAWLGRASSSLAELQEPR